MPPAQKIALGQNSKLIFPAARKIAFVAKNIKPAGNRPKPRLKKLRQSRYINNSAKGSGKAKAA